MALAELAGGGDGYAEVFQAGTSTAFFFGARIAFYDFAKFFDPGIFLTQLNESHALFQARWSELETFRVSGKDLVVFLNSLLIIFLGIGDFAEVELRVGGEVGVAVEAQIILEFGAGEIVFAAGDVAETVRVERVCGRRRAGRRVGGYRAGRAGCRSGGWSAAGK